MELGVELKMSFEYLLPTKGQAGVGLMSWLLYVHLAWRLIFALIVVSEQYNPQYLQYLTSDSQVCLYVLVPGNRPSIDY
jgi:hypothetical protein